MAERLSPSYIEELKLIETPEQLQMRLLQEGYGFDEDGDMVIYSYMVLGPAHESKAQYTEFVEFTIFPSSELTLDLESEQYQRLIKHCSLYGLTPPTSREELPQFLYECIVTQGEDGDDDKWIQIDERTANDFLAYRSTNFDEFIKTAKPPENADTCCDICDANKEYHHWHAGWDGDNKGKILMTLALLGHERSIATLRVLAQETSQQKYPELGNRSLSEIPEDELLFALSDLIIQRKEKTKDIERVELTSEQRQHQLAACVATLSVKGMDLDAELKAQMQAFIQVGNIGWYTYDKPSEGLEIEVNRQETIDFHNALKEKRASLTDSIDTELLLEHLQSMHHTQPLTPEEQTRRDSVLHLDKEQFSAQIETLAHEQIAYILERHMEISTRPENTETPLSELEEKLLQFGELLNEAGYYFVNRRSTADHTGGYHGEIKMINGKAVFHGCAHHTPGLDSQLNNMSVKAEQMLDNVIAQAQAAATDAAISSEPMPQTFLMYPPLMKPYEDTGYKPSKISVKAEKSESSEHNPSVQSESPKEKSHKRSKKDESDAPEYKVDHLIFPVKNYKTFERKPFSTQISPKPQNHHPIAESNLNLPTPVQKPSKQHNSHSIKSNKIAHEPTSQEHTPISQEHTPIPKSSPVTNVSSSIVHPPETHSIKIDKQQIHEIYTDTEKLPPTKKTPMPKEEKKTDQIAIQIPAKISFNELKKPVQHVSAVLDGEIPMKAKPHTTSVKEGENGVEHFSPPDRFDNSDTPDTSSQPQPVINFIDVKPPIFPQPLKPSKDKPTQPAHFDFSPQQIQHSFPEIKNIEKIEIGSKIKDIFEKIEEKNIQDQHVTFNKKVQIETSIQTKKEVTETQQVQTQSTTEELNSEMSTTTKHTEQTTEQSKSTVSTLKIEKKNKSTHQEKGTSEKTQEQQNVPAQQANHVQTVVKTTEEKVDESQPTQKTTTHTKHSAQTAQLAMSIDPSAGLTEAFDIKREISLAFKDNGKNPKNYKIKVCKNTITKYPCSVTKDQLHEFVKEFVKKTNSQELTIKWLTTGKGRQRKAVLYAADKRGKEARSSFKLARKKEEEIPNTLFLVA